MKPHQSQPRDITERLASGERPVLVPSEKADLKRTLMEYVDFHTPKPAASRVTVSWWSWSHKIAVAVLLITLTTGGLGTTAAYSLPGDALYAVKLQVIEPVELAVFSPTDDVLSEQTFLMERRLAEVQALLETTGSVSPDAAADVTAALAEYTDAVATTLTTTNASSTRVLVTLDTASALIDAHETLLTGEESTTTVAVDDLDTMADTLKVVQSNYVTDLVEGNATSTLTAYLDISLDTLAAEIATDHYASSTIASTSEYIDEAKDALLGGSFEAAHEAIAEANQLLLTEAYLSEDAESTDSDFESLE